jgi:DNA-binding transcriptional LysR family regulator
MSCKSEYIKRAERLEAQAEAFDDPQARAILRALIDALYEAARSAEAEPGSLGSAAPPVIAEFTAAVPQFRRTAAALRRRIAVTVDLKIVNELGKLAGEYDLLAVVVGALAGAAATL